MFNRFKYYLETILIAFALLLPIIQPSYALSIDNIPQPLDKDKNHIVALAYILNKDTEKILKSKLIKRSQVYKKPKIKQYIN